MIRQVTEALGDEAGEGRVVVIETTTLDIDRGEPATAHVRASLEGLAHVVTANKGPAAFAYADLEALAESVDRVFFFEGAVMDGVPIFNLVRETHARRSGLRGFAASSTRPAATCSRELERGLRFDDALAEMQARGIAEADPSLDIDGWDAAAKTAALVNVLMDGGITPHDVARTGIRDVSPRDVADAATRGRRIRLVASAARHDGRLEARVEPELLDLADPARVAWRPRKRALSADGSAGRGRHRPAHEHADADRLCAAERSVAHQPAPARLVTAIEGHSRGI